MLYFAYGSNMDPDQMIERCHDAKLIGLGYLPDHILCFPRRSKNRGCGVSSVTPKIGHDTWGVVWELSDKDFASLDSNEGYRRDREPSANAYNRRTIKINLNGEWMDADTYLASPQEGLHLPSLAYLDQLRNGATHHGLPEAYRNYLAGLPDDLSIQNMPASSHSD
ncbi:gamma-glutamylcyclotransferase family protein [Rhizobium sp. BR 362]|uniref:gamma-glutamylcyclotransferase family protein n=1 Tax=Rhizobium sp. BR 362 TaxID=3040670 RepID=UPI002F3E7545